MKAFTKNELTYKPVQSVNNGTQWRCDYPDGQYALAMVYKKRPTRSDVIEAIDEINSKNQDR